MDNYKAKSICKEAIELWGHEAQIKMWHEEVGELMQAISKHHRKPSPETLDHLCEEVVDVKILTMQLELMGPEDKIKYWFDFKMNRLVGRIMNEKFRRLALEESLSKFEPEYSAILKMIHEVGLNPSNIQMEELINFVVSKQEIIKDRELNELF